MMFKSAIIYIPKAQKIKYNHWNYITVTYNGANLVDNTENPIKIVYWATLSILNSKRNYNET